MTEIVPSSSLITAFLHTVSVVDCETTTVDETGEVIELATSDMKSGKLHTKSMLIKPLESIPPDASAINNISNSMVENEKTFSESLEPIVEMLSSDPVYWVAHNAKFDIGAITNAFRKFDIEQPFLKKENTICTMRLAKHIFAPLDDPSIKYSQQFLRYFLNLDVSSEGVPHRAGFDTIVCYHLLETLVKLAVDTGLVDVNMLGTQLHELCWKPIPIVRWPCKGKHKNDLLVNIPTDYYEWALRELDRLDENSHEYDEDLANAVAEVLDKRLS